MISQFHVSVAASRDVKIPLHLIPLQTAKDPTTPPRATTPADARRPLELLPLPPTHLPQHMSYMGILFFLLDIPFIRQAMRSARIDPMAPIRGILSQQIAGKDAVARGILDIDVQVVAEHGDDDVEIDLQLVGNAFFDGEEVGFMTAVPAEEFADGEEEGDGD